MYKKVNKLSTKKREYISGLVFTLPVLIFVLIFVVLPIIFSIMISFTKWKGYGSFEFIGLANYIQMFTKDENFITALKNSVKYSIYVTSGTVLIGFILATFIDLKIRFYKIYRFIFFLGVILSVTVTSFLFGNMFDPYGLINSTFIKLGIEGFKGFPWLGDFRTAFFIVMSIDVWQFAGFPMLFFLAGMQNINEEIYEAAKIDGASTMTRIFKITIPLLKNVFSIVIVLMAIFSFKVFDRVFVMTSGGPAGSTQVLGTELYKNAFKLSSFGYASVIATVMLLVAIIFSIIYSRVSGYNKKDLN